MNDSIACSATATDAVITASQETETSPLSPPPPTTVTTAATTAATTTATTATATTATATTTLSPLPQQNNPVLGKIAETETAFTHVPEHGFSLFLAQRTKTIHFIRHAEGYHNDINRQYGDDTPVTYTTPDAWQYQDAKLTPKGIQQCVHVRQTMIHGVIHPELIVVSPFTRTLQTAHLLFSSHRIPFLVHDLCGERRGKFTCDKRRSKSQIVQELQPLYTYTNETIDFTTYAYATEEDEIWDTEREADHIVTQRCIAMMQWLGSRPERDIAVVTHSSWLKHLFRAFGHEQLDVKDQAKLHRLSGNAEIRSITLALHRGFYPSGTWETLHDDCCTTGSTSTGEGTELFVPTDHSFRIGRYAPPIMCVANMHQRLVTTPTTSKSNIDATVQKTQEQLHGLLKERDSMPY
jgi:broad specificity phosphatase PhoE